MLKPLGNRVLLEIIEEESRVGGIILPDSAKEKPNYATVIAVGEGKLLDSGERLPLEVNVGDKVVFEQYAGTELKHDGVEYLVVKDTDIIAVSE